MKIRINAIDFVHEAGSYLISLRELSKYSNFVKYTCLLDKITYLYLTELAQISYDKRIQTRP